MKLIAGLGNVGIEYDKTRHNAGFAFVDSFDRLEWKEESKWEVQMARDGDVLYIKPTTFMNESGRAIRKVMDFYKIEVANVIVVHDDLDLALGEYKIQLGVGPKVHNGVASVENHLGKDFLRVRLGIDNREPGINYGTGADYVLSRMPKDELEQLNVAIEEAKKELQTELKIW